MNNPTVAWHAASAEPKKNKTSLSARVAQGLLIPVVLASVAACDSRADSAKAEKPADQQAAPAGAAAGGAPKLPVGVVTAEYTQVNLSENLPGRIEASRVAEIRARAAGILEKRLFKEGSDVKAGDLLFQIDAAPYQAAYNSAKASLARAQTNQRVASQKLERYKPLLKANAVSRQDYDDAQGAYQQAVADVAVAQAAVRTAQINLSYASVTAPISGRIGRALVTEGALVGQGAATPMATIQQIDPVFVNITQPSGTVMKLQRGLQSGKLKRAGSGDAAASVRIRFDDGSEYDHKGSLLFTDLTVDESTGQVTLRAEVPNPDGTLLPGMYVRAEVEQAEIPQAILIPQQAVTRTGQADVVTIVAADGTLSQRPVRISGSQGSNWIVVDGLQAGEKVMVDGFQAVQMMGLKAVTPVPWQPGKAANGQAAPAGQPAADQGEDAPKAR